jgi:serine O-acetyltransferase
MAEMKVIDNLPQHDHGVAAIDEVLPGVVAELQAQAGRLATPLRKTFTGHPLPSRTEVVEMVELLRSVIFPGYVGNRDVTAESLAFHMGAGLHQAALIMVDEVHRGLCFACVRAPGARTPEACLGEAQRITADFLRRLPELRRLLALDAVAAFEGDPAASSAAEAIFCYPGVLAMSYHRIAHELYRANVPLIPRIISEEAHGRTGIDIHPGATIGERFFIDHGTGVVIGETAVIGSRVRVYQGVTLGAKSFPLDEAGRPIKGVARHPIIEDEVTIYSGATVLGRITVGRSAVIGGNVWLTRDVPPGATISQSRPTTQAVENGGGI